MKKLIFILIFALGINNILAENIKENIAKGVLFLPGVFLEEYFASIFDEKGHPEESSNYVFIPYLQTTGIHLDYERYIVQTLTQYIKDVNRYKLKAADKENRYLKTASVEITNNIAKRKGCRYALYINISKRGEGVLFAFVMKDTENNSTLWHDEYKALIPEDIAPILFRVANSMGTGKNGSNPKSFYDNDYPIYVNENSFEQMLESQKTDEEKQYLNEDQNPKNGPHIGIGILGDLLFHDTRLLAGIKLNAWYDWDYFILEGALNCHGLISRENKIGLVGLNLWFPFFHGNAYTPYAGAGIGVSSTKLEDQKQKSGLTANIGAGYMLNRFNGINLRFGLTYYKNIYEIEGHKSQGLGIDVTVGI